MLDNRILSHKDLPAKSPWWVPWAFAIGTFLLGGLAAQIGLNIPHTDHWRYPGFWPPLWIFWAVWVVIYPCWGLATYLIWCKRHEADVRGALALFVASVGSGFFFMPIASLSNNNPGVMTMGDLNGIVSSLIIAWLYTRYDRRTIWLLLPLLIWMPITFGLKLLYWSFNV